MSDPNKDMSKEGWKKELTYKFVDIGEKEITVTEVDFYVTDIICNCKSTEFLWLVPQRAGVYLACKYCETVTGPLSRNAGASRNSYKVTPEKAIEILLQQGAQLRDRDVQVILHKFKGPAKRIAQRPRPKK